MDTIERMMMRAQYLKHTLLACTLFVGCAIVQAAPVKINAWGIHYGGEMVYRYQIQNNSASTITGVDLGVQTQNNGPEELPGPPWSVDPTYDELDYAVPLPANQCKPFVGMVCEGVVIQFPGMNQPRTLIGMYSAENDLVPLPAVFSGVEEIRAGALSSIAELHIPLAYQSLGFLTASGEVHFHDNWARNADGTLKTSEIIPFTKVDTIPPTLTVTLTPNVLLATNQLYPITANIAVTDNYDPQPEIKLESITVSEVSGAGDIVGATLGTDDRQFQLLGSIRQVVLSKNSPVLPPRIYTVTYSAMDGSGNKALATATLSVNIPPLPCVGLACFPSTTALSVSPAPCVGLRPCSQPTPVVIPPPPSPPPVKRPWWKFW